MDTVLANTIKFLQFQKVQFIPKPVKKIPRHMTTGRKAIKVINVEELKKKKDPIEQLALDPDF